MNVYGRVRRIIFVERESGAMNRFITTVLDVYCLQSNEGCKWIGKIHDYQVHEKDHCEYIDVECRYQECDVKLKRKDLEKHEQECQYRLIQCEWCEDEHPVIQLEEHYESCPSYPVQCPNEGCEEEFKRSDKVGMEEHMNKACEYQEINCQFHSIGCSTKVLRRLLDDHLEDCVHEHASLMMKELTSLKHEAKKKDQQLIAVENELAVSKKREMELGERIIIIEEKLAKERAESEGKQLIAVENELAVSKKREMELEERIITIEKKLSKEKAESEGKQLIAVENELVASKIKENDLKEKHKDYKARLSSILNSMKIDTYYTNCYEGYEEELFIKIPMGVYWVNDKIHIYFSDDLPKHDSCRNCVYSSETVAIKTGRKWMEVHLKNQELVNKDTSFDCYVMHPSLDTKEYVPKISEGHCCFNSFGSSFLFEKEDENGYYSLLCMKKTIL